MVLNSENNLEHHSNSSDFFIPDLCNTRSAFLVVLVSELLALVISLVQFQPEVFWQHLGRYSLVIQWIALLSTYLLCTLRPVLSKMSDIKAGLISYLLVLFVTLVIILVAIWTETWLQVLPPGATFVHPALLNSFLASAIFAAIVLRFFYLQAQYRKRIAITADAKLQALQARIQPHFLFNSMNIIAGLIHVDPDLAEKLIEDLSDLFRASLAEHRSQVSLQSEIDLCKSYLGIEQLRLGDRLKCQWQIPDAIDFVMIPPLTLQPLIENAIYHGIQPLVEGGLVNISVNIVKERCVIIIENPLHNNSVSSKSGNSIAVENIRERLEMLYGEKANLDMNLSQLMCKVTLTIPCEETDDKNSNRR